ncbi:ECF-type sigma factor [Rubrivirga sp. IMCC43871]|uniref:ECF-type sigma factor n=1 Tax=Rubrivirga sp. IMCC43871 TaxID=3391575 RepID=UPI00398FC8B2
MPAPEPTTQVLLARACDGDGGAVDLLLPRVYDELRRLAAAQLRRERADHTLQPTALVHEAYLRLVGAGTFRDRAHFAATAGLAMRRILTDHAKARLRKKRGGGARSVTLDVEALGANGAVDPDARATDMLALDRALERLAAVDGQLVRLVECRFYAGMSAHEAAEALDVSARTAARMWKRARAHLRAFLDDPEL